MKIELSEKEFRELLTPAVFGIVAPNHVVESVEFKHYPASHVIVTFEKKGTENE